MQYVTLDELNDEIKQIEARTAEPPEFTEHIQRTAAALGVIASNANKVKIIADYDADGICFGYIMEKTLRKLNPELDLEVIVNDRRNPYGVPKNLTAEPDTKYIIGDMGSNELDYIKKTFGEDTIVIDHHVVESPDNLVQFKTSPYLLNSHSVVCNDGKSPDYCATGLAYRVSCEIQKLVEHEIESVKPLSSELSKIVQTQPSIMTFIQECRNNGIEIKPLTEITNREGKDGKTYKTGEFSFQKGDCVIDKITLSEFADTGRLLHAFGDIQLVVGNPEILDNYKDQITAYTATNNVALSKARFNMQDGVIKSPYDEKFVNTRDIFAGIGTVADMVNVADEHGFNRQIIKTAMQKINNADEENIEFALGYMLAKNGITETDITTRKIGFNISPFLNSASRMSEIINANGAQKTYDAIAADKITSDVVYELDELCRINQDRKDLVNGNKNLPYYTFIESQRYGREKNRPVAVWVMPDNVNLPPSFCGLLAGQIADATNKPAIVLSSHYDPKENKMVAVGSARNAENKSSLKDFLDFIASKKPETMEFEYGGHPNAAGIRRLTQIQQFIDLVNEYGDQIRDLDVEERRLKIDPKVIKTPETLQKILALEPLGEGFKLPLAEVEGKETYRDKLYRDNLHYWKSVRIKDIGDISDWSYSENSYPADNKGNIAALVSLELSDYKGLHVELSMKFNQEFISERTRKLTDKQKNLSTTDVPR